MKRVLVFLMAAGLALPAIPAFSAEGGDDFGNAYFTAAIPEALGDDDAVFSAEDLSRIEPAAGESVFLMPGSGDSAPAQTEPQTLPVPETGVVPGMTHNPQ